jgi:cytosine deaminase
MREQAVRDFPTASIADLVSGQPFALTGGAVIQTDGSQAVSDIIVGADGRFVAIGPSLDTRSCSACVDITDMLVSPGFVDVHQHLDKTGVLHFTPNPSGTLQGAREAFAKYARTAGPDDIHKRAMRTIRRCLSRGTTAIRSHVNVDKDAGFHGIETLAGVRDGARDDITLQLVAFMTPHPGQDFDWLTENIDGAVALADAVGGTPAVSEDPPRYLDMLFSAAVKAGKPVDLHLDEHLNADVHLLDAALERVERFGMQGRTVFSHVSVLSALPRKEFQRIAERLLALDVGVVTLPAANLYLQGRDAEMLPPRGLTRVAELYRAGVTIAAASDNIQDPFVPTGSGDMLEIARWTLLAGHLRGDELAAAHRMITTSPARLMSLGKEHGLKAGARADFVIADCTDTDTLVAGGPDRAFVFSKGRLVSQSTTDTVRLKENA